VIAGERWSLTGRALELLLDRLDADPERAAEKYRALHRRLSAFFIWRGAAQAEELADLTLDRVMRKLEAAVPVVQVPAYAAAVARRVLLEAQGRPARRRLSLTEGRIAAAPEPADPAPEALARRLDDCLAALPAADRELILDYYRTDGRTDGAGHIAQRKQLARRLGVGPERLRARAFRIRCRLEECVKRRPESPSAEPGPDAEG
jgi:DNA-directed RNA polymerase specialized sigma24 family protein